VNTALTTATIIVQITALKTFVWIKTPVLQRFVQKQTIQSVVLPCLKVQVCVEAVKVLRLEFDNNSFNIGAWSACTNDSDCSNELICSSLWESRWSSKKICVCPDYGNKICSPWIIAIVYLILSFQVNLKKHCKSNSDCPLTMQCYTDNYAKLKYCSCTSF
jgi:hypothetical protein